MIALQVIAYTSLVFTLGYLLGYRMATLSTLRRLRELRPWLG
jgi:hypothetical protein